ncbi:MAG: CDP-alcohol phosphatidyltransferase family protein [Pseudomonadales bacterium]|nr:CDP-alcohol phosphatidyltransferase family protein [Pseudomonadales bacterium]
MLVLAAVLSAATHGPFTLRWLPAALVCWSFVIWQCNRRLHKNRQSVDGGLQPTLGVANLVTLMRGLLIAATAGFLFLSNKLPAWTLFIPAAFYTLAALGDLLDGYLARRRQQTTQLGSELDTALDALGLLIAPLVAVLHERLYASYLLVSVAYYLFQSGLYWRRRQGKPVYPLPPSTLRRQLAGFQMGLVAAALWPPLPGELTRPVGFLFMLPLLFGFWRDWLSVSGRLPATPEVVS